MIGVITTVSYSIFRLLSSIYNWVLDEIQELVAELPPDRKSRPLREGDWRLYALWKHVKASRGRRISQFTPLDRLRDLLI